MKTEAARWVLLMLFMAGEITSAAPEGPQVRWIEDPEAVIEQTLKDGTMEEAGPTGKWTILLPPRWKVVVETEFNHANFEKPVISAPIEWSNPQAQNSTTPLNFQNWVRFRGKGPSFSNRFIVQLAGTSHRDDFPGALFNFAHEGKMHRYDFPGFKPGLGRFLLVDYRKNFLDKPDPFFWFKIYLRFVPPADTI